MNTFLKNEVKQKKNAITFTSNDIQYRIYQKGGMRLY